MGNCTSTPDDASWKHKYDTLKFQTDEAIGRYKAQTEELTEQKDKAVEQGNLVRFKVEVLINMLAIEEKKIETSEKRLEALKWVLLSQGVSQNTVANLIDGSVDNIKGLRVSLEKKLADFDMSTAISRMATDFEMFRTDIIQTFADEDGKIVATLSRDEFMRQLYSVTEHVSKNDCQLLALRFFDGTSVSVAEFLTFFTTPAATRQAKAAASAVRMSLDLLDLDISLSEFPETPLVAPATADAKHTATSSSALRGGIAASGGGAPTIRTKALDASVQKLLVLWPIVFDSLIDLYNDIRGRLNGSEIILESEFKTELLKHGGPSSETIKTFLTNESKDKEFIARIKPLTADDVDMISERFEIGGRVHFGHFLQFFNELIKANNMTVTGADADSKGGGSQIGSPVGFMTPGMSPSRSISLRGSLATGGNSSAAIRPIVPLGASPFRTSSEWKKLKQSASVRNVSTPQPQVDDDHDEEDRDDGSVAVRSKVNNALKLNVNNNNGNNSNSKPPLTPAPASSRAIPGGAAVGSAADGGATESGADAKGSAPAGTVATAAQPPPAKAPKPSRNQESTDEKVPVDAAGAGAGASTSPSSTADAKPETSASSAVAPKDDKDSKDSKDAKDAKDAKAAPPANAPGKSTEIDPAAANSGCFGCFASKKPVADPNAPTAPPATDAGTLADSASAATKADAKDAGAAPTQLNDADSKPSAKHDGDDDHDYHDEDLPRSLTLEDIRKKLQEEDRRNQETFGSIRDDDEDDNASGIPLKQAMSPVRLPGMRNNQSQQQLGLKERVHLAAQRNIDRDNSKVDEDD